MVWSVRNQTEEWFWRRFFRVYVWEELLPLLPEFLDCPEVATTFLSSFFQLNYVSSIEDKKCGE